MSRVRSEIASLAKLPGAAVTKAKKLGKAKPMLQSAVRPLLTGKVEDWRSEYAYSVGLQAFIYGFPYIYNAQVRHKWVTQPRNPKFVPYAAVNEFWHAAQLMDATYRDGGCPNNDTLYSIAWLDLGEEPIILSHPDMGERYFTFELMGVGSDNIDYIGQRTTGSKAASFAIVGPGFDGELPDDVDQSRAHSPSRTVLVMGRTLVDNDPDDVAEVKKLQEQYLLTPLSEWGKQNPNRAGDRDVLVPIEPEQDPIGPFKTLNAMLEENPPPAHHEVLMRQFAHVGIGPGLDLDEQPEAVKQGLVRAELIGMALAQAAVPQRRLGPHRPRLALSAAGDRSLRRRLPAARRRSVDGRNHVQRPRRGRLPGQLQRRRRREVQGREPISDPFRRRQHAAGRLVLVAGDVRHRPQSGRQPDRPLLDRRPDGGPEEGPRRGTDDPSAGRGAGG